MKRLAAVLLLMFAASSLAAERPADFGRQWVRSHPLTVMGVSMLEPSFDINEYKAVNFNALLAWKVRDGLLAPARQAGLPYFAHLYAKQGVNDEFTSRVKQLLEKYPNNLGFIINDEPVLTGFKATAEAIRWMQKNYPQHLVMSNAWPIGGTMREYSGGTTDDYSYSQYVADYMSTIKPDVLMFDVYIYSDAPDGESGVSDVYWQNLKVIRAEGLKHNVPYWTFVQSYKTQNRRLPSESDLRMQMFSSLTYGFTGIAHFTYDCAFDAGLLEAKGDPSPLYAAAAKANQEVIHLGQALRCLTSTEVRFVPATPKTRVPVGLDVYVPGKDRLRAVSVANATDQQSALLGGFVDDTGKQYFMLTNLRQAAGRSAEQCRSAINLKFDPRVKSVLRLSRQTGRPEKLAVDPKTGLTIELNGGTGDLFKFDDGPFAGLAQ